jgi:heme exporter protein D
MNWAEFFNMGGYAFYVWGSYGAFALMVGVEIMLVAKRKRRVIAELRETKDLESHEVKA